ncbi:hypothetical protein C942_04244 [Photobacterium marinum]|uniref:Uncharacterized protein n=1 Tax=Photobacterium marinum TaxID=1056511 RepID=L8JCI5_9GAMM|nr:hypothetical protein C942_04244 [Photobacterium marinum]
MNPLDHRFCFAVFHRNNDQVLLVKCSSLPEHGVFFYDFRLIVEFGLLFQIEIE